MNGVGKERETREADRKRSERYESEVSSTPPQPPTPASWGDPGWVLTKVALVIPHTLHDVLAQVGGDLERRVYVLVHLLGREGLWRFGRLVQEGVRLGGRGEGRGVGC